ncbi:MAG TPA: hypothetical protein VK527_11525 [Candidatus Limnocylindrales bacterium]|nr:hypothetical protein [Candidatus Limnocylindrales bacterium]
MRRLPVWILCLSFVLALTVPLSQAAAKTNVSFNLRIGERYRGPDLGFYDEPNVVSVGNGVYYVRDSNHDVYRYGSKWYYNYNGDWYSANTYRGPWVFVGYRSVPRQVYTVSPRYRRHWRDYRDQHYSWGRDARYDRDGGNRYGRDNNSGASITLRIGDRYRGPNLGFNDQPAVVRVPGRGVYYVQDSDYDVYRSGNYWYMNYNGDWYRAGSYRGPWIFVGYRSVPRDVYTVPTQYRRWQEYRDQHYDWGRSENYGRGTSYSSDDRVSVGGGTGASITLRIGQRYNGPDLGFYDEPEVVAVPGGRGVYYVRDANNDVYRYSNNWYLNYNGDWYRASSYNGPWVFVGYRSVPRDVYSVPTQYRRGWTDYRDQHYDWNTNQDDDRDY